MGGLNQGMILLALSAAEGIYRPRPQYMSQSIKKYKIHPIYLFDSFG
jgi:hypothetical protein